VQIEQVGNKNDYQFIITKQFQHEIGFTPAQELKGLAEIDEGDIHYESIFNVAVPHLNLAVIDSVALLNIKQKVGYPTRVIMREKCMHSEMGAMCDNGIIRMSDGEKFTEKTCSQCRGTGYLGIVGINSELVINSRSDAMEGNAKISANDALAYVGPSTDIPKFYREEIEHEINRAKEVLHLKSEPRNMGTISATEKNRDKENTEAFIKPISDQIWEIIAYTIECIGVMKFGRQGYESLKPKVIPAASFDLLTTEDIAGEISEAKKAGVPEIVVQDLVYDYMQVANQGDTMKMRMFQLIEKSDRLLTMDQAQVAIALSRGLIQKWEAILHASPWFIILTLHREIPNFFDLEESEQIELIQAKARELEPVVNTDELPPPIEP
jgi:hypothetical protein